jgi:hypothetical protein
MHCRESRALNLGSLLVFLNYTSFGRYTAGNGFGIVCAHTDSPCLKLKPSSKVVPFSCLFKANFFFFFGAKNGN